MTPDEARRFGIEVGHGEYRKKVPLDKLDIFEERDDYDIQELLTMYEEAKENDNESD